MSSELILVTGSAGRVGQAVVQELLARGERVRGFDRVPTPGLADAHVGNLTDVDAVRRAAEGTHAVIHLAATPDDADFVSDLLPNNLLGVYHLMEAVRLAGTKRLVLASSGQVNWWQRERGGALIRPGDPLTPRSWYAAAKVFAESIGQSYAEMHGLSVIAARLGWCPRPDQQQEFAALDWAKDVYFSPGDVGTFFHAAVKAPLSIRFAAVNAFSRPVNKAYFDQSLTKELLGWEPQEQWPTGLPAGWEMQ